MAMEDKIQAAKEINELLNKIVHLGAFRLKYRIAVDPPAVQGAEWDAPAILVDFSGPDADLLTARGGELLNALELVTIESVGDLLDEGERISFDAAGFRQERTDELVMAAKVAADKVRDSGKPYAFAPMNSRERRVVHLALKDDPELRTESEGEGRDRHLVIYPKDYQGKAPAAPTPAPSRGRGRRR
ncbi:MAG: R3H domain-containing nucleic acid-binding protein [Acidobacteriota bacterium]|nr:R3H domain-containing nucleic acid-binding protein [Acidobacteriota bacterium]